MPVPIVLQNIGIFWQELKGNLVLQVLLSFLLLATGLPVLSGGRGGMAYLQGPSGFLFLYPVVAYFIGIIRDAYLHKINFLVIFIATLVIGVLGLDIEVHSLWASLHIYLSLRHLYYHLHLCR